MPLYCESLQSWTSAQDIFCSIFANQPNAFWLDRKHHPTSPFSIMGVGFPSSEVDVDEEFDDLDLPFAFRPMLVGVLHYSDSADETRSGDWLKVDRAFVYDHTDKRLYFIGRFQNRAEFDQWHHAALLRLALIGGDSASYALHNPAATSTELVCLDPQAEYQRKIELAKDHIAKGDVYQLCLTTQLVGEYQGDELSYFLRLRRANPAPYSSFIRIGHKSYVSISPERFMTIEAGIVTSSPIKGTRPRSQDPVLDAQLAAELGESEKEQAENLMIVDLVRNDLSMVCEPESILVSDLLKVRSYSTVHQLVSDVRGALKPGVKTSQAIAALFPGGSMTGAPKIRATEIIRELETAERGGYSGAIGFISGNGNLDLGMVIRTAVFDSDRVTIGIGGGITSGSEVVAEHQEIQIKAQAHVSALSATVRW
jgi:anthranilate/para-aminobenzoate synthase component I